MTTHAWLLLAVYLLLLLLAAAPLGHYIAAVMEGRQTLASRCGSGIESGLYRICGVRKDEEMGWLHTPWPSSCSTSWARWRSMPCNACNSGCR